MVKCQECSRVLKGLDITSEKYFYGKRVCKDCWRKLRIKSREGYWMNKKNRSKESWMDKLVKK